jgi:hypothetical protein
LSNRDGEVKKEPHTVDRVGRENSEPHAFGGRSRGYQPKECRGLLVGFGA